MKQIARILLAMALLMCIFTLSTEAQATSTVKTGVCGKDGNNVSWTLDNEGVLTISGSGAMKDYTATNAPFNFLGVTVNKVVIEYGVTTIGSWVFSGCRMAEITIPKSVTSIEYGAFYGCPNLENLVIPDSVTHIGIKAFAGPNGLVSIKLPAGLTSIPDDAFQSCEKLTSIVIPEGVTSIGKSAFYRCISLTTMVVPKSLTSVSANAFTECDSLWHVLYAGTEAQWETISIDPASTEDFTNATRHYGCAGNEIDHAVTKAPTCSAAGKQQFTCKLCNESVSTEAAQRPHRFGYVCNGTCAVCGEQGQANHTWDWGNITKEPNCMEEGVKTYTCRRCPETREESVEKTSKHTYDHGCDAECNYCGKTRTTSHKWDSGTVTQEATCKDEGVITYTCTACKETKTEPIEKMTTHTYDHACDTDCNICGEMRTTSHVPGEPATETTDQVCTECGVVLTPATGPAPTEPTQPTQPNTTPTEPTDPTEPKATQPTTGTNDPTAPVTDPVENDTSDFAIVVILIIGATIGAGVLLIVLRKKS